MNDTEIVERILLMQTPRYRKENEAWLAAEPPHIQDMAKRWPMHRAYQISKPTCARLPVGTIVALRSFFDDGTATVHVLRDKSPTVEGEIHTIDPDVLVLYEPRMQ